MRRPHMVVAKDTCPVAPPALIAHDLPSRPTRKLATKRDSDFPENTEKTAMGRIGRGRFSKLCTDVPYLANVAICSHVNTAVTSHLGPPLSIQGPRLAILKYQGSDPTQPYPTFVVRQSATLLYGFAPQRK